MHRAVKTQNGLESSQVRGVASCCCGSCFYKQHFARVRCRETSERTYARQPARQALLCCVRCGRLVEQLYYEGLASLTSSAYVLTMTVVLLHISTTVVVVVILFITAAAGS